MIDKITLIYNGGYKCLLQDKRSFLSMGIFQLKAYLQNNNFMVQTYNLSSEICQNSHFVSLFQDFFVNNYIDNLRAWQEGTIVHEILEIIKNQLKNKISNEKIIGLSILSLEDVLPTLYTLAALKEIDKQLITVLGGPYLNFVSKELLADQRNLIDFIVKGDGEYALKEILLKDASKEKLVNADNLLFYHDNQLIDNQVKYIDFNDLTCPEYETNNLKQEVYYSFSRGCAGQCSFCNSKPRLQFKDLELIKKELAQLINQYNPAQLYFVDSSANNNVGLLIKILDFLQTIEKDFEAIFWVDFHNFNNELIDSINKYAGHKKLTLKFGLESGDPEVRNYLHKPVFTNKQAIDIINGLKINNNISLNLNVIIGIPYEKLKNFLLTINFIDQVKNKIIKVPITIFQLTPQSIMFNQQDNFKIKSEDKYLNKYNYYYNYCETEGLNSQQITERNRDYWQKITTYLNNQAIKW